MSNQVIWGYEGEIGPEFWDTLCEEFHEAAQFPQQSPIDLTNVPTVELDYQEPLVFSYVSQIFNQRVTQHAFHLVPQELTGKSFVTFKDQAYYLQDIHVHFPSEHILEITSSEAEWHFVHKNEQGQLLVLGLLFNSTDQQFYLKNEKMRDYIETHFLQTDTCEINPGLFLPKKQDYYHYVGSLTTPPTQGPVYWFVMDAVQEIHQSFMDLFKSKLPVKNHRPVQPLNDRKVWYYEDKDEEHTNS